MAPRSERPDNIDPEKVAVIVPVRVLLALLNRPAPRRARWLAGLVVAAAAAAAPPAVCAEGFAGTPPFDPLYPKPPYLQTNVDEYMVTVFEADRDAIQALLPPGIHAAASNTVGISHYVVRQGAGLAPYEASYIFAEVDGFDDPAGGKGRWFLYGLYSPDRAVAALREVLGFSSRSGTTKLVESGVVESGKRLRGAGSRDGKELFSTEIQAKGDGPAPLGGVLHYPVLRQLPAVDGTGTSASELVVHHIAWTANVQMADPVSAKLAFPEAHPLSKLQPKKLLYAYFGKDVNFVFGHAEVIGRR
jgi:hypothetical protein